MVEAADIPRDLSSLVVACRGSLEATGDLFEPYRLVDAAGGVVGPVAGYLRDLQAAGRSPATQRCLAAARGKLTQLDELTARLPAVQLGMPSTDRHQ